MKILPIYASILSILFVYLSVRAIRARRSLGITLGHSENPVMLRAMRVHANFAEYVPLSIFVIYLVEVTGANVILVHALGIALVVARISHAYGVSQVKENFKFRVFGMVTTFSIILVSALFLLTSVFTK